MSPLLIPILALAIPVLAIFGGTIVKPWFAYRHRRLELETAASAGQAARHDDRVEQLERRVRVLERIVTDRGADLSHEIERLRDPSPALPPLN